MRERDKRPLIRWEHLHNERPTEDDVAEWFRRWPHANVGIVTGEISNLIVLDVDPKHGGDDALERRETGGPARSSPSRSFCPREISPERRESTLLSAPRRVRVAQVGHHLSCYCSPPNRQPLKVSDRRWP
ncbi:MAG: bifunctional DNA primase/polymerase [Methyloceanibacter sp.]|nr:bifunctional DNA primase/polymerase [Methyloceanibacter sp.]